MNNPNTSFDRFAKKYEETMGGNGDYTHQHTIDPALDEAIGNVCERVIYDLGCGNGNLSWRMAKRGAKEIWASDVSEELIRIAQDKYENPQNKMNCLASKTQGILKESSFARSSSQQADEVFSSKIKYL